MAKKPETIRAVQYTEGTIPAKKVIVIPERQKPSVIRNPRQVVWTGNEGLREAREKRALQKRLDKENSNSKGSKTGLHFVQGGLPELGRKR